MKDSDFAALPWNQLAEVANGLAVPDFSVAITKNASAPDCAFSSAYRFVGDVCSLRRADEDNTNPFQRRFDFEGLRSAGIEDLSKGSIRALCDAIPMNFPSMTLAHITDVGQHLLRDYKLGKISVNAYVASSLLGDKLANDLLASELLDRALYIARKYNDQEGLDSISGTIATLAQEEEKPWVAIKALEIAFTESIGSDGVLRPILDSLAAKTALFAWRERALTGC